MKKELIIPFVSLLLGGSINSQTLDIKENMINVNPTEKTREYSLLETSDLKDNEWITTQTKRGTESNLVFNISKDYPTRFYKTRSQYQPLEPKTKNMGLRRQDAWLPKTITNNYTIVNLDNKSLDVEFDWVETSSEAYPRYPNGAYLVDLPKTFTLQSGTNNIPIVFYNINLGTGRTMKGYVKTEVIE